MPTTDLNEWDTTTDEVRTAFIQYSDEDGSGGDFDRWFAAEIAKAQAPLEAIRALHSGTPYWMNDEMNCEGDPEGYVCLECSPDGTEDMIADWEFWPGDADSVPWPCKTYLAAAIREGSESNG